MTRNSSRVTHSGSIAAAALLLAFPAIASGSSDSIAVPRPAAHDSVEWTQLVPANGEVETYLRYLQAAGAVPRYPWSIRGFSRNQASRLAARVGTHPWTGTRPFGPASPTVAILPAVVTLRHNTSFPYGNNDGAVWAGRGLTASISGGLWLRLGPISAQLNPVAFVAQNSSFPLLDNRFSDGRKYADGLHPTAVDRPQRFGDGSYRRVDPGNSTIRITAGPVAGGISTANVAWGPFERYPFLIGTNAPGIPHGFAETAHPLDLWVGSLHGKVLWGILEQSAYSPVAGSSAYQSAAEVGTRRFASGLVLTFQPRVASGLELGVARFFHSPWPKSGIPGSYFRKPFDSIFKRGGSPSSTPPVGDNQLVSAFARWVFPPARFEMYAEYGREDHSWDKRDFVQEPDHSRSYALGFRKTMRLEPNRMDGLTLEIINFQLPHLVRTGRAEGGIYVHDALRQGHTNRGQLLGADIGVGSAAGATLRWDGYRPAGRTSFSLHRAVRQESGAFHVYGSDDGRSSDVQYVIEVERVRRMGRMELTTGLSLIHQLNRDFREDATAASVLLGVGIPLAR